MDIAFPPSMALMQPARPPARIQRSSAAVRRASVGVESVAVDDLHTRTYSCVHATQQRYTCMQAPHPVFRVPGRLHFAGGCQLIVDHAIPHNARAFALWHGLGWATSARPAFSSFPPPRFHPLRGHSLPPTDSPRERSSSSSSTKYIVGGGVSPLPVPIASVLIHVGETLLLGKSDKIVFLLLACCLNNPRSALSTARDSDSVSSVPPSPAVLCPALLEPARNPGRPGPCPPTFRYTRHHLFLAGPQSPLPPSGASKAAHLTRPDPASSRDRLSVTVIGLGPSSACITAHSCILHLSSSLLPSALPSIHSSPLSRHLVADSHVPRNGPRLQARPRHRRIHRPAA